MHSGSENIFAVCDKGHKLKEILTQVLIKIYSLHVLGWERLELMPTSEQGNELDFGPYRAILRTLLLRAPETARTFLHTFRLDASEVLNSEFQVAESAVSALWSIVQEAEESHPLFSIEAASLFQLSDLGERGWILSTAQNIETSLTAIQMFWPELVIESEDCGEWNLYRLIPTTNIVPSAIIYFGEIFLNFLAGQGVRIKSENILTLPQFCEPSNAKPQCHLRERISLDFGAGIKFDRDEIAVKIRREILSAPLKTADEVVFQLFLSRCNKKYLLNDLSKKTEHSLEIEYKIKRILLRNLSSSHFGSQDVCGELGVSLRTLERILAEDNQTLRTLKQQVQRETAEEMLKMGVRVKEVATKIGFEDAAAFSRAFHKWAGVTPSQFRKKKSDEK